MRRLVAQIAIQIVAASACASSWTVDDDGPADFDNIQAAVDASISGDEIICFSWCVHGNWGGGCRPQRQSHYRAFF